MMSLTLPSWYLVVLWYTFADMPTIITPPKRSEVLYQLVLLLLAGGFFLFDRQEEVIDIGRLPSFVLFVFAALFIGYVLLPLFFYRKQYTQFFVAFFLVTLVAIFLEEFVVEKIFYPDTRGSHFHGVFWSLLEVLPVLLLLVSFKFAWDLHQKQKAIEELQLTAKDSELRFLKSQINPHFLFNNLNNLYSYSITEPDRTSDLILKLSTSLRYMLYDCQADEVALEKELAHLEDFVGLNELQIEERGQVTVQIDNQSSGYQIAPLILTVFIENAFKHSTASMYEGLQIDIAVAVNESGALRFSCKNKYQTDSNTDQLSNGIGLANVRKRLELLYPATHQLSVSTEQGYYVVDLSMQL